MVVLLVFALVAGAATAVSPCVLPVLPLALSAGLTGGRRRPLGVVTGLALSFTFAVVALVYVIAALGLPNGFLRTVAIMVLALFGLTLLVPRLADRLEARLTRLGALGAPAARSRGSGFWSGLLVGGGLGLVYAPCAGPILAGVITASASQTFTAGRLVVAGAYGVGSAVALYLLLLGGRRLTSRLARRSGRFQAALGAVMVLVALLMLGNYDTRFETQIASGLPSFLVHPADSLETSKVVARRLASLRTNRHTRSAAGISQARAAAPLPVLGRAPEIQGTQRWFNTPGNRPLTLASLRGRVVLVDFWTYSCINCLRTLPYLKAWDARYRSHGLTIIGVHTPEFPFERSASNVAQAIAQNGIRYPVAQDNEMATWSAYGNQYWPAEYFVDARGRVRLVHFGEGEYAAKEQAIRKLLIESGASGLGGATHTRAQQPSADMITPESYLGAENAQRFANGPITPGVHDYGALPARPRLDLSALRYGGQWRIGAPLALAQHNAGVALSFQARRVFIVLGSPGSRKPVHVLLDGRPITARLAGADVHHAMVNVGFQRLYRIVDLPGVQRHVVTLRFAPGVRAYSFTFG
jgi:cytochrome c biogenesis protein CcdA/thiol-disulfide isomerase/thioredoxin